MLIGKYIIFFKTRVMSHLAPIERATITKTKQTMTGVDKKWRCSVGIYQNGTAKHLEVPSHLYKRSLLLAITLMVTQTLTWRSTQNSLYVGKMEVKTQWARNPRMRSMRMFMLWEVRSGLSGLKIKESVIENMTGSGETCHCKRP